MATTMRFSRHIHASPAQIYRLLIDRDAVQHWKVPDGMSSYVHIFEPIVGGAFRVSLTYNSPDSLGKTSAHTDTYHGHFVSLIPNAMVVEVMEFETNNPALAGEMTITYTLTPSEDGTDLVAVHAGLPDAVSLADNELGWKMSLDKLTAMAEASNRSESR